MEVLSKADELDEYVVDDSIIDNAELMPEDNIEPVRCLARTNKYPQLKEAFFRVYGIPFPSCHSECSFSAESLLLTTGQGCRPQMLNI